MGPYSSRVELDLYFTNPTWPIRDLRVGGVGDYIHHVCTGINPGDIHPCLFPGCRIYSCMCGWIMILGWDPIVPR